MASGEVQGLLWGAAATDWAEIAEPGQIPFYEAAFAAIELGGSSHLLDVGCGAGLDASTGLLDVARQRLSDVDLRQGDIEELPWDDDTFNAVTAFNSVQYASDPQAALAEIRRVASPGSPVAIATWGRVEQCEMRVVLAAIGGLLPPPPPGAGGPFALAAPDMLEHLVAAAGLKPRTSIDVPTPYIYPDLDTAVRGQMASGPARMAIERNGPATVRDALADALTSVTLPDGSIRLDNVFKVVVATA